MCKCIGALVVVMNVVASMAMGGEPEGADAEKYHVEAVRLPDEDLSGPLGPRCLALLSEQVSRNLDVMEADRKKAGLEDPRAIATDGPYFEFFTAGSAYAAAVLVRCGEHGETMGGLEREELRDRAVEMIQAVARDHRLGGGGKQWSIFRSARIVHLLGMAAWLLWEELDEPTRVLAARIIEHEADRFLDRPAPARLHGDTQAESNAWTGGGLAVAACMLKSHPHRDRWAEKANEYMIGAFVSLPDGRSVYLEQRRSAADVVIESATSGDVTLFDDVRWYRQTRPRAFFGEQ